MVEALSEEKLGMLTVWEYALLCSKTIKINKKYLTRSAP